MRIDLLKWKARAVNYAEEPATVDGLVKGHYKRQKLGESKFVLGKRIDEFTQIDILTGVFNAWRKERGVVLHPDQLLAQAMAEVGKDVRDHPEHYRSLLTDSNDKKDIRVVGDVDDWPQLLWEKMKQEIASADLKAFYEEVIAKTTFPGAGMNIISTQLEAGEAFFDFYGSKCGIPSIRIYDDSEAWTNAAKLLERASHIFGERVSAFLHKAAFTLSQVAWFVTPDADSDIKPDPKSKKAQDFFKETFVMQYGRGSGWDDYQIRGWLTNFYRNSDDLRVSKGSIERYSCQVAAVPVYDETSEEGCFFINGLCGSTYEKSSNEVSFHYKSTTVRTDTETFAMRDNAKKIPPNPQNVL